MTAGIPNLPQKRDQFSVRRPVHVYPYAPVHFNPYADRGATVNMLGYLATPPTMSMLECVPEWGCD